jgi:hypothetical protein
MALASCVRVARLREHLARRRHRLAVVPLREVLEHHEAGHSATLGAYTGTSRLTLPSLTHRSRPSLHPAHSATCERFTIRCGGMLANAYRAAHDAADRLHR